MSKIFTRWKNKEVSDIDCIRELNRQNGEMLEALIECIKWFKLYTNFHSNAAVKTKNIIEKATGLKIEEVINE